MHRGDLDEGHGRDAPDVHREPGARGALGCSPGALEVPTPTLQGYPGYD